MSLTSEYLEAKKKKKKKDEDSMTKTASTGDTLTDEYLKARRDYTVQDANDIAPVYPSTSKGDSNTEKKDQAWWEGYLDAGAFSDGYQIGDLSKTILGTLNDVTENVTYAALDATENLIDTGAYLVGAVGSAFSDDFGNDVKNFIAKEPLTYKDNAEKLNSILNFTAPHGLLTKLTGAEENTEDYSVIGDKGDGLVQSAAHMIGAQLIGAFTPIPAEVPMAVNAFGSEIEQAFQHGESEDGKNKTSYLEAGVSGAVTAAAEILTEKLFGGIKIFKGSTLDEATIKPLINKISNRIVRTLVQLGVDVAGEGFEEYASGVASDIGQKLTYADEKEWGEIFASEERLDDFIGGAIMGAAGGGGKAVNSAIKGQDYSTGLTANEEKVVRQEYEKRIAQAEAEGKKLGVTEKNKIWDTVIEDMGKGYISTDAIEEALGGEDYSTYKETIERENALKKELDELRNMKSGDMTDIQKDRLTELKAMDLSDTNRNNLRAKLDNTMTSMVSNSRLTESYNERSRRSQAYTADLSKYNEKQAAIVQKAIDSGILNNTNRTHEFVDMVSKISADKGVSFDFANNEKLKESGFAIEGKTINGFVTKDGVTLNIDSAKSLNSVVGHEISHVLEGTELYADLQKAIIEYAKGKGDYQARYDSLNELYKGVDGADIDAELTADLVGDYLFTDKDFVMNLSTKHRNVFKKIYDEIKYLFNVATAGSKEKRQLEKVKHNFEQAYKESGKASEGTKYSMSDNTGKALTNEQSEYFKNSKVRDDNGNLKVMHHGTNESFTVFDKSKARSGGTYGKGFYFTDSTSHAATYGESLDVYLNITNPLQNGTNNITKDQIRKFVEAIAENEDYGIDNYGYDATIDSVTDSVYGKSDFGMILDLNISCIGDMVEAIELFNKVNGTNYDGIIAPTETVAFYPEQVKSVANEKPTGDPDMRFSLSESVEETKDLMALHNLKSNELLKSLELGGLPMPSLAIIKADAGHEQYGDISLIFPKETIDPQANRDNKVYGGDAWTPTYPRMEYKASEDVAKRIRDKYYALESEYGYDKVRPLYDYVYELENSLNRSGGEAALKEGLYDDTRMMQVYLLDSGKGEIPTVQKEIRTELTDHEVSMYEFFAQKLGNEVIDGVNKTGLGSPIEQRKAYWEQNGEAIKEAYGEFLSNEFGFSAEDIQNVLSNMKTADFLNVIRATKRYQTNGRVTIKTEADYSATREAIKKAAGEEYKAWVDDLFAGSEEKAGIRNNVDYYTRSGNRRSWEALHWENTLENVVKAMKQQDSTGSEAVFGVHKFFAASSKDYKSVADIKADSDRLHKIDDGEYQAAKDAFESRFVDIANRIMDKTESNPFIAQDNAMECIVDAIRNNKTETGIYNELKQYGQLNVTKKDVADIVSLVTDISNMPTGYFEAKPQRAVGFDEVGVFVIPYNTDPKLKQELLNRGYAVAEYNPDVEGDRQKVVNSFEEYKFSLSPEGETPKSYGKWNISGEDVAFNPAQEDISKVENTTEGIAPVAETVDETVAPVADSVDETVYPTPETASLYNTSYGEDGWGKNGVSPREALNAAVQIVNPKLLNAINAEYDSITSNPSRQIPVGSMPIDDAMARIEDYVRQDTITPMQAAMILSKAYNEGGVEGLKNLPLYRDSKKTIEYAKRVETEYAIRDIYERNGWNNIAPSEDEVGFDPNDIDGIADGILTQWETDGVIEGNALHSLLNENAVYEDGVLTNEQQLHDLIKEKLRVTMDAENVSDTVEESIFPKWAENSIESYKRDIAEARANAKPRKKPIFGALKRLVVTKAKKASNTHGVLTSDGKQYLSHNGFFVVELNTPDKSIIENESLAVDKFKQVLENANNNTIEGNYIIDPIDISLIHKEVGNDNKSVVIVGEDVYDIRYLDAVLQAITNPTISRARFLRDMNSLLVKGDNGQAMILPIRIADGGKNLRYVYKADKVGEAQIAPEGFAPIPEAQANAMQNENIDSLTDADAPVQETAENIAPIAPVAEKYEAIRPQKAQEAEPTQEAEPRMKRVDNPNKAPSGKEERSWVETSTGSEAVDGLVTPDDIPDDVRYYQVKSNKKTLEAANRRLAKDGYAKSREYFEGRMSERKLTVEDIALGERLIQEAAKAGDAKAVRDLIIDVSIVGTELGQRVQALSMIRRLTPEGQLKALVRTVERGKAKGDKAFDGVEVTEDMTKRILDTIKEDGTFDQAELNAAVEDVKQQIAKQMPTGVMDYINAWRYLSMLGNPKTHIRNVVSNVAMMGTREVKNMLARTVEDIALRNKKPNLNKEAPKTEKPLAPMREVMPAGTKVRAADRDNIGTIQSFNPNTGKYTVYFENAAGHNATVRLDANILKPLNPIKKQSGGKNGGNTDGGNADIAPVNARTKTWARSTDAVKTFAKQTTKEMDAIIKGDTKYSEEGSIKAKRQIFKTKAGNFLANANNSALEFEDSIFSKLTFKETLQEYLTANGVKTEADIKNNPELVEKAKDYALEEAKRATFRQDSYFANKIAEIENKNPIYGVAIGSVMPFKKTPINVAKTGLAYSPLGFARNIYDFVQVKKGNMDASVAVDHLAQTLTGTGLTVLGFALANMGIISGAGGDDKEGKYDYQLGQQSYSLNLFGNSYSLSWLTPVAMPLFVGANAYETLVEQKEWDANVVVDTLAQTLDPLSEMSFLSSLDDVLSSYDSGVEKIWGAGESMVQNYVTQFIPTLSSQVAATFDDTKRSTKASRDSGFKFGEETLNKIKYKIPGLRNTLEPTTDIWGNEAKQTENFFVRGFESFFSPANKREGISTEVDEEIKDLYRQTGKSEVIPSIPYDYINYDGEKYDMSADEYTAYKQNYGQTAYELLEKLFETDTYKSATSEERAEMVRRVYDHARDNAKKEYFDKLDVDFTNAQEDGVEVYKEDAIKGAIEADLPVDEYQFSTEYPEKYKFFNDNDISYETYKNANEDGKRAYSWAYENPGKYTMSKAIADDFLTYYEYKSELNDLEADKDEDGKSISGSKKEKVIAYINNMDLDYGQKIILYRSMYDSKEDRNTYNYDIVNYLNSRNDISYEDMVTILKELGFTIDSNGNVYW